MMRRRFRINTSLAVAVALWLAPACSAPQRAGTGQNASAPRMADGKVDFSGLWVDTEGVEDLKPDAEGNITVLTPGRPCHPG